MFNICSLLFNATEHRFYGNVRSLFILYPSLVHPFHFRRLIFDHYYVLSSCLGNRLLTAVHSKTTIYIQSRTISSLIQNYCDIKRFIIVVIPKWKIIFDDENVALLDSTCISKTLFVIKGRNLAN